MQKKIFTGLLIITAFSFNSFAQESFGFGCLGLVGAYGGYSYQKYKAVGFNEYVEVFNDIRKDSLAGNLSEFGTAKGYRIGINLFRANFEGFILTAKGFYQFIIEKSEASINSSLGGVATNRFEFEMKSWGVGFDLGTSITKSFSWKVIDAALLFNSPKLVNTINYPGVSTRVSSYERDKSALGYSVGTGFIYQLIDEYITIEGLLGYTVLSLNQLQTSDGVMLQKNELSTEPMNNFIESFGFNAVIQLNIGFPL